MLPLPLLQILIVIGHLVGKILHYAEGNSYNQNVFSNGCKWDHKVQHWLKERKGKDYTKSPKFSGTRDLV